MFKFILLTLLIVGASVASSAAHVEAYDDTADILEMAFEAVDNGTADDTETDDSLGYRYKEGALEDNINIAVNAAILDKYGQAATSERTTTDVVAAKTGNVQKKSTKNEKTPKSLPYQANKKVQSGGTSGGAARGTTSGAARGSTSSATRVSTSGSARGSTRVAAGKVNNVDSAKTALKSPKPASVPRSDNTDTITRFVSQVNADGTYGFDFEQSSGLEFKEFGHGGHYAQGSYQYISPEGEHISVTYNADENGFHPESDSIPTPPPIPAYILKALEYIREHPTAEELADREVRAQQI